MKYLKKYQTKSAYDADYYSGAIPFPHVALVAGEVFYAEQFESVTDERTPMYVEALEDLTVKFSRNAIQYSMNNSTWVDLPVDTATPTVSAGSKIYFRATGLTATSSTYGIGTFTISGKCNLGGNTMSMLHGADFIGKLYLATQCTFCRLFYGQAKIINAKRLILPAMTLKTYCYAYMFYGCSSLEEAPELPAMGLSSYCYQYMFYGCSSLKKAPVLPATTMQQYCYYYMFYGCSSLEEAPELPATGLNTNCYQYMFQKCSSLKKAPALPAMLMSQYCYGYMFSDCASLEEAPELPAMDLSPNCYGYLFYNCTSLKKAPALPALTLQSSCYSYMFSGCTSLEKAPVLPALTLQSSCYSNMFSNCSNLQYIKAMFTSAPNSVSSSNTGWVSGVAAAGTFVKNPDATWENTFGANAIPTGWEVVLAGDE